MNRNGAVTLPGDGRVVEVELGAAEQERLVRAIASALSVQRREDFLSWVRREFHSLLPHEGFVCVEMDALGEISVVATLQFGVADACRMEKQSDVEAALALQLVRSVTASVAPSSFFNAAAVREILAGASRGLPHVLPPNAMVHRIRFISGTASFLVLFGIRQDQVQRHLRLFELLSAHVKMALAWALAARGPKPAALTPREREILGLMAEGHSNREISVFVGISPITLRGHVNKIYRKLNVQSREEAVRRSDPDAADPAGA